MSLISAFDLFKGLIPEDDIYASDVVFLDSGGYEARLVVDSIEPYLDHRPDQSWTVENYQSVLDSLKPLSDFVIVSFDHLDPAPIADQVRTALSLFEPYPLFGTDFLCKPASTTSQFLNIDELIRAINILASFDVLGVTEKELGGTVLERCKNLLRIRKALHHSDSETPIHVFGCLDPITMIAYFLCGADIFDGLAWLRFSFLEGIPNYHMTSLILCRELEVRDEDALAAHRMRNLDWLQAQTRAMNRFLTHYDMTALEVPQGATANILELVQAAGVEI